MDGARLFPVLPPPATIAPGAVDEQPDVTGPARRGPLEHDGAGARAPYCGLILYGNADRRRRRRCGAIEGNRNAAPDLALAFDVDTVVRHRSVPVPRGPDNRNISRISQVIVPIPPSELPI